MGYGFHQTFPSGNCKWVPGLTYCVSVIVVAWPTCQESQLESQIRALRFHLFSCLLSLYSTHILVDKMDKYLVSVPPLFSASFLVIFFPSKPIQTLPDFLSLVSSFTFPVPSIIIPSKQVQRQNHTKLESRILCMKKYRETIPYFILHLS